MGLQWGDSLLHVCSLSCLNWVERIKVWVEIQWDCRGITLWEKQSAQLGWMGNEKKFRAVLHVYQSHQSSLSTQHQCKLTVWEILRAPCLFGLSNSDFYEWKFASSGWDIELVSWFKGQTGINPSLESCTIISPNTIWAASWQNQQNDCVPSKDSDQAEHQPSLIRVFAARSMGGCPAWSEFSLGAYAILLVLSCGSSYTDQQK